MPKSKGARKPNQQQKGNGKNFNQFGKKNAVTPANETVANDNPLLKEILSLGGSNDDFKLVENVDEDDKEDFETGSSVNDSKLANELQKFMKGMNFDKFSKESAAITTDDEEEAEEENDGDGYEDVEDGDEQMEEEVDVEEAKAPQLNGKQGTLHIEPAPQWHSISLPALKGTPAPSKSLIDTEVSAKYQRATELLDQENTAAESHPSLTSSDRSFLSDILKSGTLNDKVSALTLLVQESPIHALRTMDTLMGMSKKKSRKEAVQAITSLKDLFIGSVLPDRKLIYFRDRPLWDKGIKDEHLIVWAYEDFLKKYYFEFLQTIEALSHDTLLHVRHNMVTCMHDLLAGKPEQEQNLLRLLVNKLGDSENKVAAKVSHLIIQLFQEHPAMKIFVIREIEQLLLRPNVSERAQYYAVVTVNQTILTSKDQEVANKLVDIYFVFFRRLLKISEKKDKEEKPAEDEESHKKAKGKKHGKPGKKAEEEPADDENSKLIGAVITGINRAFPYSKVDDQVFENNMDILFRITHTSTFNTSIQALMLIFQVCTSKELVSDRFYRTLYESLLDPRLVHSSKQAMYMNLLFKALRADNDLKRVKAFVKRMIQIAAYHQPTFICGILYLADKLMVAQPGLRALITQPEEDDDDEHFEDAPDSDDEQPTKSKATTTVANSNNDVYDGRKRDPRFANADKTCLWELNRFTRHYHPSVCKFAQCILKGERIETAPDLRLHTLMHFLDRFVYRNAKKKSGTKGSSIMQPLAEHTGPDQIVSLQRNAAGLNQITVNSEEFWRRKVEDVPVDELFFHKYFNQKVAGAAGAKPAKKKKEVEEESEGEEDEVWRAMVNSMPGEGGGEDVEDLEEDDDSEDDEEMQALLMDSEEEDELDEGELGDQDFDDMEDMDDWEDEEDGVGKRKAEDDSDGQEDEAEPKKKRSKKPRLPTFASYEDYEAMLDN
ncbi:RNA-binding ribosome biosynthesis protein mak21 [Umbelopsis sp. WA50703]